jgi:C4-dicarboxylate-specific signal transduction histidine kinase/ActR/RegA family two-component response regulator
MARILLVAPSSEDQDAIQSMVLSASSHTLVTVGGGADALVLASKSSYDAALVEVELPDIDGFEVCRSLQEGTGVRSLPVILLANADRQVEYRQRGLACGASDFVVRPLDAHELLARISSVLRSSAMADEARRHNDELAETVAERTGQLADLANELRIERDALRETFNVFQDGLFLLDGNGAILIENTAGRQLLADVPSGARAGAARETGDGSPRKSFRELVAEVAGEALRQNATTSRTLLWRGRQLDTRASPAAGSRVLVSVRDVTEERDREIRRLQSEKLASIGMLAAGIAHEINNPASFVLANVDALAGILRKLDETLRSGEVYARNPELANQLFDAMTVVQESKEGMARIHRIARDLHSFSRVDDDANALSDVNSAVDSALTMLRSELRYRATVERSLRATQMVRASAARLGQVFLNLLVNAAHALADLHPRRNRLYVRSRDEGPFVVVEVEDNGPGIAPHIMPRIFESFFTTKPPELGTGLGLPISLDIVKRAGGELTAESEPGRGALFRVRLPAAMGVPSVKTRSVPSLRAIQRRRVLAIDDEALLLKAFQRMLVRHHDIETKLGAREALRCFGQDREFDIVLCDLQMPDMSGVELYQAVKQQWPGLAERFIFITGGAFSAEARRFLEDQEIACINKPFQLRELLELIEARVGAHERS